MILDSQYNNIISVVLSTKSIVYLNISSVATRNPAILTAAKAIVLRFFPKLLCHHYLSPLSPYVVCMTSSSWIWCTERLPTTWTYCLCPTLLSSTVSVFMYMYVSKQQVLSIGNACVIIM